MAPSKGIKKEVPKYENGPKIDDSINTDSWKCVVVMAVERTYYDCFVVKEFIEESSNGRRQEISLIDYSFVIKLLYEFENGEFSYKYTFLLNFSPIFQEAIDYINRKVEVPTFVLAKVVKAVLFNLREESLIRVKRAEAGLPDPIKAMAERPFNFGTTDAKNKETIKKGDNGPKVRPPSLIKQDTDLLKRNEKAKDNQRIDDAPHDAYFNLYVLLTGFYNPDFPLELIKAGIPLHALLCVDTSFSGAKQEAQIQNFEIKSQEIQNFWKDFLKILWDPKVMFHFKDVIFQVYVPQRLLCGKKKLREFIYREISYIMYDLSDLKRQLLNYLQHLHLCDVTEKEFDMAGTLLEFENFSNECVTVPVMLQFIINAICKNEEKHQLRSTSTDESIQGESDQLEKGSFSNRLTELGAFVEEPTWTQKLEERKDFNLLSVYFKTKELDVKYDLDDRGIYCTGLEKSVNETENSQVICNFQPSACGENMEEALLSSDGIFRSYWKKYQKDIKPIYGLDYCLYSHLMTKVVCPYKVTVVAPYASPADSYHSDKKNSFFELIENLSKEMRRPHFTVTDGSRSILKSVPYNVKNTLRNFFCPEEFKIVSPEKLKASSAPEFRVTPNLKIQTSFISEIFPLEIQGTPFEALRGFIDDCLFSNTNDFNLLEFLSKSKLLKKEYEYWSKYNCIDHSYSLLNDCILIMLHNRKDKENIHHETFNESLKTTVGLRDFYEYVLEDESEWLKNQEQLFKSTVSHSNKIPESNDLRSFTDSDFWLNDSIKQKNFEKNSKKLTEILTKFPNSGEMSKTLSTDKFTKIRLLSKIFEGYDVSDVAVQFSGLKTIYYTNGCRLTVQLIEKLYGNQELGIHVTALSHTLHLYSYVCPEPHILDPFTFHLTYENGIIIAFERRFVETFEEIEEIIESRTLIKGKKNSSELSTRIVKKLIPKTVKDTEFIYNMSASFPNGLSIKTVRKIVKPCYIKQHYQVNSDEVARVETSRLFLPNGNLVKVMRDGTVEILKVDATIVTANLSDLVHENDTGNLNFAKFEMISGEGYAYAFEHGEMTSSKRLQVFQNTDVETGQVFFRRRDGTNYLLRSDGSLCVQFRDGTKISSSVLETINISEPSLNLESGSSRNKEIFGEADFDDDDDDDDDDFVLIYTRITTEHPDYATVIYDSLTQTWRISLPYDSSIMVKPSGNFNIEVDEQTELSIETTFIQMNNFSRERQLQSTFTADLSVFENKKESVYCHMKNPTGKTFIVEGNSNCYMLNGEENSQEYDSQEESTTEVQSFETEASEFVASEDLQTCPSIRDEKSNKLSRESKYFVIKRDITGVELFHVDDVRRELKSLRKGCLVYTQNIPNTEHRCFVLITPKPKKRAQKWAVDTILPNPKFESKAGKKTLSSTYGVPPSWMHPFPKQKIKFVVPQPLTCRVFVETKKTNLSPQVGTLDYYNCELDEINEIKYSRIPSDGVEEYFKKLSNDDQDTLREMYTIAAGLLINEKKRLKPINSEKLEHYLQMSKYFIELREYHKKCIRHHIIPNYFLHPAGKSWLILNELLEKLKLPLMVPLKATSNSDMSPLSSKSASELSYEEIEYNLSLSAGQSFTDLSCRSDLSAHTAPAELRTGNVCRCKVKATKDATSSPVVKCYWTEQILDETNSIKSHSRICDFHEDDIEMVKKTEYEGREAGPITLEDLMYLGLI